MFGLGVWAASGALAPVALETPMDRVASPASMWIAAVAALAAWTMPACRRYPALSTPALLATLPWLPLPLPTVALLWSGRLAWVPVGLSAAGYLMASASMAARPPSDSHPAASGRGAGLAGLLTLALVVLTGWSVGPQLPGGDEPHYLIIAESLLKDRDLRIENNHASGDYRAYFGGTLTPHYLRRGQDGAIYSIHAPGVPALVTPLFAAFGYRGAQATVMLMAALAGGLIWLSGWLATGDDRAAWFAWAAVVGAPTFLVQAVTIFPDGPGATATAAAVVLVLMLSKGRPVRGWCVVGVSALLAILPFLHTRFAGLAAGLGALILWQILATPDVLTRRVRAAGLFLVVPVLAAMGWFGYFWTIYGTLNPAAPYGSEAAASLAFVPGGLLGILFDQQFGLLAYAPVLVLAAGAWSGRRGEPISALWQLQIVALLYLALVASYWMWWAGVPATPARFAASVLPLLAPAVAVGWYRRHQLGRVFGLVLLGVSLGVSAIVIGTGDGVLAWNSRDGHAAWLGWFGSILDLPRVWPSFFWRLDPDRLLTELPFAGHVALWLVAGGLVSWGLARSVPRGEPSRAALAVRAVWFVPATVTVVAVISLWSSPQALRPADAQLRVLADAADRRPLVRVGPGRLTRVPLGTVPPLRITVPRVDVTGSPAAEWMALARVPAGRYDLRIQQRRPLGGSLTVGLGRQPVTGGAFALARQSEQTLALHLPAGAGDLRLIPDDTLAATGRSIELLPRLLEGGTSAVPYRLWAFPAADVYFLDDRVFLEPDGFWIHGVSETALVIVARPGASTPPRLRITNGAAAGNEVLVVDPTGERRVILGAWETMDLAVPITDGGAARFRIRSSAGFRPSDDGVSTDRRFLGVRVSALGEDQGQ